ncbi:hypothetical protein [Bradyrhizobium neotropicale]|uniref:hypothetical protein n=1 Tax=Bradyrhizobium neotropicale TaxID=1497615 RepID=UPI001AD70759|nr:hypothetical protein [Bradyrhizobium neotropicale]MBO4227470.1 hypothetical protein [Bradyrhizobium neotropicale]
MLPIVQNLACCAGTSEPFRVAPAGIVPPAHGLNDRSQIRPTARMKEGSAELVISACKSVELVQDIEERST